MNYPHTFPPYEHQRKEQEEYWDVPWRAWFWEQGLGKMKAGWDWALTLWQAGKINTFVVLAPQGVHRDWIEEGFKEPNPDNIYDQPLVPPMWHDKIVAKWYHGGKAGNKGHQKEMRDLFHTEEGKLAVLAMTYDSVKTERNKASGWIGGKLFATKMLKERGPAAMCLDESSYIQTPSAKVTKTMNGWGRRGGLAQFAEYRRIAEGTPVDEGPFNAYSQMQFLDRDFWDERGFSSFSSYKAHFGLFQQRELANGRKFNQLLEYRNLNELRTMIAPHMSRLEKDDVLDLPPKIHVPLRFDLSPEQWRMYKQLQEELMVMAKATGQDVESLITAELPIVNILKLYQITAGYLPFEEDEDGEPVRKVVEFKENPRLETATQWLQKKSGKVLIWCRFRRDIDLLCAALGKRAVRYDGTCDEDERAHNKQEWLKGDAQYLIPQIQAMARGHTLNITEDVMYYTNDSRLRLRRQSEDRTHRGKMKHTCTYTDMMATDTVDEKRVKDLRRKLTIAKEIIGDKQ